MNKLFGKLTLKLTDKIIVARSSDNFIFGFTIPEHLKEKINNIDNDAEVIVTYDDNNFNMLDISRN